MALMIRELYDALKSVGASDEQAGRAAEAVAVYDERFSRLEGRLSALEGRMSALEGRMSALEGRMEALEGRMGALEGRFTTLQWTVGVGLTVLVALQLFMGGILWQVLTRLPKT